MQAKTIQRSTETVRMVRVEKKRDGTERVIHANLPVGRGWNQGHGGAIDWINLNVGWRPYDEYMAEKHSKEAEKKRAEAATASDPVAVSEYQDPDDVADEPKARKAKK